MDEELLFDFLESQNNKQLLTWLRACYEQMTVESRWSVFYKTYNNLEPKPVDGEKLKAAIDVFEEATLDGEYYREIVVTYRNYDQVPEETNQWYDRMNLYLKKSLGLVSQGDWRQAVDCFQVLDRLYRGFFEDGKQYVFDQGERACVIDIEETTWRKAYVSAVAHCKDAEESPDQAI